MSFHGLSVEAEFSSAGSIAFFMVTEPQSHVNSQVSASHFCFQIIEKLHATCVFKPQWSEVFHSTSVIQILLNTHNREQPLKCPPISFKIASVTFCILVSWAAAAVMKAAGCCASTMWRWHSATSQDVALELQEGVELRLKLTRISVNTGFFGLVCGSDFDV